MVQRKRGFTSTHQYYQEIHLYKLHDFVSNTERCGRKKNNNNNRRNTAVSDFFFLPILVSKNTAVMATIQGTQNTNYKSYEIAVRFWSLRTLPETARCALHQNLHAAHFTSTCTLRTLPEPARCALHQNLHAAHETCVYDLHFLSSLPSICIRNIKRDGSSYSCKLLQKLNGRIIFGQWRQAHIFAHILVH
jgi:hypothetical protein